MSFSLTERQGTGGSGSGGGGINTSAVLALIRDHSNNMTIGDAFPSDPLEGDLNYFVSDNITGLDWKDSDETTDRTTPAYQGNIARYNGSDWVFFYNFRNLIEALARSAVPQGNADGGITIGATFPTGVSSGHVHLLTTDNTSISYVNAAGESVTAMAGDFAHYDGSKWVLLFRFKSLTTAATAAGLTARNFGATFPTSPKVGEVFVLLADIPSGIAYKTDIAGAASTIVRSAQRGQVFEYQAGSSPLPNFWILQGNINPPPLIPFEPVEIADDWVRIPNKLISTNTKAFYADSDELIIANNGQRARLLAVQSEHALVIEDFDEDEITTFIVASIDGSDNRWVRYTGEWTSGIANTSAAGNEASISHIPHSVEITKYIDVRQLNIRECSFGTSLPEIPRPNETFVFLDSTTTDPNWIDITGSPQGAAVKGDVTQYVVFNNVLQWLYIGNIGGGGSIDTSALDALRMQLEAQIALINNPISTHQLIAKSKTTTLGRYNQNVRVDTDWALERGIPEGFEAADDNLWISREYRGYISVETWQGDTLLRASALLVSDEQASASVPQSVSGRTMGRFNWLLLSAVHNGVRTHQLSIQSEAAGQAIFEGLEFRVYAEVAAGSADIKRDLDAVTTRVQTAETEIDALESSVANIPLSSEVLWATSKVLPTAITGRGYIDVDWTMESDLPTGVVRSGAGAELNDFISIPKSLRGELHVDIVNASDVVLSRVVIAMGQTGNVAFRDFATPANRIRAILINHQTDSTLVDLGIDRTVGLRDIPAGSQIKVYAVSAVPRSKVDGITQAQLDAAIAGINDFYIDVNPRYAFMRTSGSTPDDLDGNFVFVFSHVPEKYNDANVVSINFQGIIVYRSEWTPSTRYIRFGFEPTALQNLRNNTGRNQAIWQVEITFFNGTTNLGSERTFVVINRG